jgi:hypothetical protein
LSGICIDFRSGIARQPCSSGIPGVLKRAVGWGGHPRVRRDLHQDGDKVMRHAQCDLQPPRISSPLTWRARAECPSPRPSSTRATIG